MTVKQAVMEIVSNLPEDCTWDDLMYRIYVRQKIEQGLKDAEDGRVVDHDEVFQELS